MGQKISIYAGPPIEAALSAIGEYGAANRSGRLNTVAERYAAMVADELGRLDLTEAEWHAILHANNDAPGFSEMPLSMLWANLAHAPQIGEQWQVDETRLAQRLRALPKSSLTAIREACDRFWSVPELPDVESFARAGIKPR